MTFYLQVVTILLAFVIVFLQTTVLPGVAESLPIIKRSYLRARKGFELLYRIDKQFKTIDKNGKEVLVPTSFLNMDEAGFREITEAIKMKIGSLKEKVIIGVGIVESSKATNVDWHTGDIIPGNLAYALVKENGSIITFPFLKDPTENRILESWVFDAIQRKIERYIAFATILLLFVWATLTLIILS